MAERTKIHQGAAGQACAEPGPDWNDGELETAMREAASMAELTHLFARIGLNLEGPGAPASLDEGQRDILLFAIGHTQRLAEAAEKLFLSRLRLHLDSKRR